MLRKIKKYLRKNKKEKSLRFNTLMVVFLFFIANALYFVSFHNLDLLHNYAMIYNDLNIKYNDDSDLLNVRDITDCTGFGHCPEYGYIYLSGKTISLVCIIFIDSLIITHVYERWIELNLKKSR